MELCSASNAEVTLESIDILRKLNEILAGAVLFVVFVSLISDSESRIAPKLCEMWALYHVTPIGYHMCNTPHFLQTLKQASASRFNFLQQDLYSASFTQSTRHLLAGVNNLPPLSSEPSSVHASPASVTRWPNRLQPKSHPQPTLKFYHNLYDVPLRAHNLQTR
jgi:hypothetical protein